MKLSPTHYDYILFQEFQVVCKFFYITNLIAPEAFQQQIAFDSFGFCLS